MVVNKSYAVKLLSLLAIVCVSANVDAQIKSVVSAMYGLAQPNPANDRDITQTVQKLWLQNGVINFPKGTSDPGSAMNIDVSPKFGDGTIGDPYVGQPKWVHLTVRLGNGSTVAKAVVEWPKVASWNGTNPDSVVSNPPVSGQINAVVSAKYGIGGPTDRDASSQVSLVNGAVIFPVDINGKLNLVMGLGDPYSGIPKNLYLTVNRADGSEVSKTFSEFSTISSWDGTNPDQVVVPAPAPAPAPVVTAAGQIRTVVSAIYGTGGSKDLDLTLAVGAWITNGILTFPAAANGNVIGLSDGKGGTITDNYYGTVKHLNLMVALADGSFVEKSFAEGSMRGIWDGKSFDSEVKTVAPAGFEEEVPVVAQSIACGSYNGGLEVWSVSDDGGLERYNQFSLSDDPFEDMAAVEGGLEFDDISVASDGTMVALTKDGEAYQYDWTAKKFTALTVGTGNEKLELDTVAVGNAGTIWAVDIQPKNLYQHTDAGWVLRDAGMAIDVAAGVDGTVVALNENGHAHMLLGDGKWQKMSDEEMETVAVGNKANIWGIGKDTSLVQYVGNAWEPVKDATGKPVMYAKDVAVNAAGTVFVVMHDGNVFYKGEAGFTVTVPAAPAVLVIQGAATGMPVAGVKVAVGSSAAAAKAGQTHIKAGKAAQGKAAAPTKATRHQAKKAGKLKAQTPAQKKAHKANKVKASAKKAVGKKAAAGKKAAGKQAVGKKAAGKKAPATKVSRKKAAKTKVKKAVKQKAPKKPAAGKKAGKKAAKAPAAA